MSRCSRRAGSAAATPAATPRSSAPTTSATRAPAIYEHALKLWEGLCQELNYNVMFSQRGVLMLAHNGARAARVLKRRVNANRLNGIDTEWLTPEQVKRLVPLAQHSPSARYPSSARSLQRRGGTARHDAVAWGYARGADALRRRHHPELRGHGLPHRGTARSTGVETTRGSDPRATSSAWSPAGHSSVHRGDGRLPPADRELPAAGAGLGAGQAVLDTVVMSNTVHGYISQSDKGELVIGGGTDQFNSYTQRGSFHMIEHTLRGDLSSCSRRSRACGCCASGAASSTSRPTARPIIGPDAGRGLYSTAAGAPAASRRRPAPATSSRTPSPTTSRTRSAAPFALDRFAPRRADRRARRRRRRALSGARAMRATGGLRTR